MSPVRRDAIAAVLLSSAVAALAQMRSPALEDATAFIGTAVRRHHFARPPRDDHERLWEIQTAFAGCSIEKRTAYEVRRLGRWERRTWVARWQLGDTDVAATRVRAETRAGKELFVVVLPCEGDRACIDAGESGRDRATSFEFTSKQIAHHVAAAFRHAATLCRAREWTGH